MGLFVNEGADCTFLNSTAEGFLESMAIPPETCALESLTHPKSVIVRQNNAQKMTMNFKDPYNFFSRKSFNLGSEDKLSKF